MFYKETFSATVYIQILNFAFYKVYMQIVCAPFYAPSCNLTIGIDKY